MQNKHNNFGKSQNKLRNQSLLVPYRPNPNLSWFAVTQSTTSPVQPQQLGLTFSLAKYGKLASAPRPCSPVPCYRFVQGRRNGTGSEGRLGLRWFPQLPQRPSRTTRDRWSKCWIQIGRVFSSHLAEVGSGTLSGAPTG